MGKLNFSEFPKCARNFMADSILNPIKMHKFDASSANISNSVYTQKKYTGMKHTSKCSLISLKKPAKSETVNNAIWHFSQVQMMEYPKKDIRTPKKSILNRSRIAT